MISQTYSWWGLYRDLEFEKFNVVNKGIVCNGPGVGSGIWAQGVNLFKAQFNHTTYNGDDFSTLIYSLVWEVKGCCLKSVLENVEYYYPQITWNIIV